MARDRGYSEDNSPAAERLDFVLWLTENKPYTHFAFLIGDSGFDDQYRDGLVPGFYDKGVYRGRPSDQVGHFLRAVHAGYDHQPLSEDQAVGCLVGHELLADAPPDAPGPVDAVLGLYATGRQCTAPTWQQRELFREAVAADADNDLCARDALLASIDPTVPGLVGPNGEIIRMTPDRRGNSIQDFRLTVRGWRFGQAVANGQISQLEQARGWLTATLRPSGGGRGDR